MSSYDLKRLETAIQYIRRMAAGRNPVTNRPAPENEVLSNINVHRCLNFIDEVLTDVHKSGGVVGRPPQRERAAKIPLSETFPYEILEQYRYRQDQQISFFLKQLEEYLPEGQKMPVAATTVTSWLRENGYLEKQAVNDTGKENSVPTKKGEALGMYAEKAGIYPNEYYRVFYNEDAQRFIVGNFRRILTEYEAIRERNRREKKSDDAPRSRRQSGAYAQDNSVSAQYYGTRSSSDDDPWRQSSVSAQDSVARSSRDDDPWRQSGASARDNDLPSQFSAPGRNAAGPAPTEDLPQEYYDMLSSGWERSDDGIPW